MMNRKPHFFGTLGTLPAMMLGFTAAPTLAQECTPSEVEKLLSSDGANFDQFGKSVAVSGNTIIVGAQQADPNGSSSGSAYAYTFDGSSWSEVSPLSPNDASGGDFFGNSVGISGDVAIVGAHLNDDTGSNSGSAYAFRFDGKGWSEEHKFVAPDAAAGDLFGFSVAISGDIAIVGAYKDDDSGTDSGSATVFEHNGVAWVPVQKLTASDGAPGDWFGWSVAIDGDLVIIGARKDDDNGTDSGSAYIFRHNGVAWLEDGKLLDDSGAADDGFGYAVDISGEIAVVGAWKYDDSGFDDGGIAYVFSYYQPLLEWSIDDSLASQDPNDGDRFGTSVSIDGDTIVVGADRAGDLTAINTGAAYLFRFIDVDGPEWNLAPETVASDAESSDMFGTSVAVDGETVVVGSILEDGNGSDAGAAYVFEAGCVSDCPADFTGEGSLDIFDILAFLDAFNAGDASADFTGDGSFDIFDILDFLDAFNAGCP